MSDTFVVGSAKAEVTPPLTVPYLGFTPRQGTFSEVHDPLHARAVVVAGDGGEVAIVSVDMIGYSNLLLEPGEDIGVEFGRRVQALTGIPADHVLLCATHAHSTAETLCITPMERTPGVRAWFDSHLTTLAHLVAQAAANKKRCHLRLEQSNASGLAWNRRILGKDGRLYYWERRPAPADVADWGANDHAVRVALFSEAGSGDPVCTLVNYTCHPTAVQAQPQMSADYPGVAMQAIEQTAGGVALFLQGMAGDVGPQSESKGFRAVRGQGFALAGTVLSVLGQLLLGDTAIQEPVVRVARRRLMLPVRTDAPDEYELLVRKEALLAELAATGMPGEDNQSADKRVQQQAQAELRSIEEQLRMLEIARLSPEHLCDLVACRIGDLGIICMPGEPFVTFGLQLQESSPASITFTVGYQGNYVGYLADRLAYERGGYEVRYGGWNRLGQGAGERLVKEAAAVLQEAWGDH